jgi:lipid-A-disaccharide synthase
MLVIFPFEEPFYRERGVDADYIGHPLADLPMPGITREQYAAQYGLDPAKQWIALLPGSRAREFESHFATMRETATILGDAYQFVVPIASTLDWQEYAPRVATTTPRIVPAQDAREALFHARGSVVASGTATVQAALMGNPFVIVYKMSPLSYWLAKAFVSVPFAGMPNLIAGREIVPELLQDAFTPENVAAKLRPLLEDGIPRTQMQQDLTALRRTLTLNTPSLPNSSARAENENAPRTAIARAAEAALSLLHNSGTKPP